MPKPPSGRDYWNDFPPPNRYRHRDIDDDVDRHITEILVKISAIENMIHELDERLKKVGF